MHGYTILLSVICLDELAFRNGCTPCFEIGFNVNIYIREGRICKLLSVKIKINVKIYFNTYIIENETRVAKIACVLGIGLT